MPILTRIEYDDSQVSAEQALELSTAAQQIVADAVGIPEVFVYTNTAQIKVNIAPVLMTIEMGAHRTAFAEQYGAEIKEKLGKWKQQNGLTYPIYLTVTPVNMTAVGEF
jgi:hypothetical protein